MISVILLSWKRPKNIQKIVSEYLNFSIIDEIIIWDNFDSNLLLENKKTRIITSKEDFGMRTRFASSLFASNQCILLHDDDTLLTEKSISSLYQKWIENDDIIHGLWGCNPKSDNTYCEYVTPPAEVDIIVGRCMMLHHKYCRDFFTVEHNLPAPQDHSAPGGCEDILMSYLVMMKSGKRNACHDFSYHQLPDNDAICDRPGHYEDRTRFMQKCQLWFGEK